MDVNTGDYLKDFKKFQLKYGRHDFGQHFNHPFLVLQEEKGAENDEQRSFDTVHLEPGQLMNLMQSSLQKTASSKVIRLIKKGAKEFEGMIKVGRTGNCDVVIKSPTISKLHAYFTKDIKSGGCLLCDAGSTNGTYVNNIKLRPDDKKTLSDGDVISFGRQVCFRYYTPEGCYDLLKQMPG